MVRYSHVIFDFGNVVVRIDFDRCFRIWADKASVPLAAVKERFVFDEAYARHERGEISAEQYAEHVSRKLGLRLSFADFAEGWNSIFEAPIEETRRFVDAHANRLRFSMLSNTNLIHHRIWSERYAQDLQRFERVYCSHEMGCRKPDTSAFEWILRDLRAKADQVVFVDDLLENVRAAEALGIRAVHFRDPASSLRQLESLVSGA